MSSSVNSRGRGFGLELVTAEREIIIFIIFIMMFVENLFVRFMVEQFFLLIRNLDVRSKITSKRQFRNLLK